MPKSRTAGRSWPCLVVGEPGDTTLWKTLTESGLTVEGATGEQQALVAMERKPWAMVLVSGALGGTALEALIARAGRRQPELPVVVLGSTAKLQDAVDAMQLGAADFIAPPFSAEVMTPRLQKLLARTAPMRAHPANGPSLEHLGLQGKSAAMNKVCASIARISRYKTNVLVLGESGSGKELIARALHALGPRRKNLFVPINCATLGREILENELFGHERGAFTGANERKQGLFELADGGTLFLDEIAELDPTTQAKLLRVLERNEFRRVGGTGKIKVDLSLIAATNRSLEEAIAANRLREDLYYRLKVVTVVVPSLRERREDIPGLIDFFIEEFNRRNEGKIRGISPQALRRLMEYDWPGNVRELKNAVESAAVMSASDTIALEDFESVQFRAESPARADVTAARTTRVPDPGGVASLAVPLSATLSEVERLLLSEHLRRARTKTEAARTLGIGLRTLYTKIRQLRLAPTETSARQPPARS
jgi:DNA-binding NtrC family response regulator